MHADLSGAFEMPGCEQLSQAQAEAVSRLLCLLEAGEGAAALSFSALARDVRIRGAASALTTIGREEADHGAWVAEIARAVPRPTSVRPALDAARRLHIAIGQGSPAERLAGVAALDSAACILFSRLLRP